VFESDPPNLFSADPKKPVKTAVVFKNLSPRYALAFACCRDVLCRTFSRTYAFASTSFNDDQVPLLRARVSSKAELKRCSIIFCVWDYDRLTPDDPMGTFNMPHLLGWRSRGYCRSPQCLTPNHTPMCVTPVRFQANAP